MKTAAEKYSEYSIQNWLHGFTLYRHHESQVTNIYLYFWESDFISITRAGLVHEYEIKISRADFKNDFDKKERHLSVQTGQREDSMGYWQRRVCEQNGQPIPAPIMKKAHRPNYFWYVCPPGIITPEMVPEYAGLIYVADTYYGRVEKHAPRLHSEKATENQRSRINRTFGFKYWNLRNRFSAAAEEIEDAQNNVQQAALQNVNVTENSEVAAS